MRIFNETRDWGSEYWLPPTNPDTTPLPLAEDTLILY